MTKLIRISERKKEETYSIVYKYKNSPGSSFSFGCNKDGVLLPMTAPAFVSLEYVKTHPDLFYEPIKEIYVHRWTEPAMIECNCGEYLTLDDPMTNVCKCGQYYNGYGQQLVPPSQWGEDVTAKDDPFDLEDYDEWSNE
jgi:hypothetical protein